MTEDYLLQVRKPARYTGGEWNVSSKKFEDNKVNFALCFPDLYEVGMSNLGIRIIYGLLNQLDGVCCQRFFAPAADMEQILRANNLLFSSLEEARPLKDFDFAGFSLGYELGYVNVLGMLDLGNIPLRSVERNKDFPLVIAGGVCCFNPEPMRDFFDLFLIGEAEEALPEIVGLYARLKDDYKSGSLLKEELLKEFSHIEGVYVPSLPAKKIKKRFIKDLDSSFFPVKWLVPYIEIIHDRMMLEVMRGCPYKCRFCQANRIYHPLRFRSKDKLISTAQEIYSSTGYEDISLAGLCVSDYPRVDLLLKDLFACFSQKAVSVSLPSIKPKDLTGDIAGILSKVKKTGLTFAPEAGSQRLRRVLNKEFDEDVFFDAMEKAYSAGYQRVKLYFMSGVPSETQEDLEGIIDFSVKVSELRRKIGLPRAQINISVNTMIPKPHTCFQWQAMDNIEAMFAKQKILRDKASKHKSLRLNFHDPHMSFIEAVFSRGDRRLGGVIEHVFSQGGRFQAWDDQFNFKLWQDAFISSGINPQDYLLAGKIEDRLPWDFIDTGIPKESLAQECANF
ncbi:MAG: radical SAM protein [Candidatus Omnitrophica bacterium]|jgi:radical SAM superfamily enzyme YgiQ (UPF0313 family)|nr:radical SAM protein [Candidatus Omnitrophota bacterium]